jgi:hypothetical protein
MDPWAIAWPRQRKMAQTGCNFDSIQDRQAPSSGFRRSAQPSSSMKIPTGKILKTGFQEDAISGKTKNI